MPLVDPLLDEVEPDELELLEVEDKQIGAAETQVLF